MARHAIIAFLTVPLVLAGCASSGERLEPPSGPSMPAPAEPTEIRLERPLLYPVPYTTRFAAAVDRGTRTVTGEPGPNYWQQQADYVINARVDPALRRVQGSARIAYHNNAPDTLGTLFVNLIQNFHAFGGIRTQPAEVTGGMELRRVVVGGEELEEGFDEAGYAVIGSLMRITPPAPVPPGTATELEIEWSFELPQSGASGRMGYSGDELLYLAYWYPQMAVYDDVIGWHTDFFRGTAEFYSEFGRYDVTIEAPEQWLVMGTGTLENAAEVLTPTVLERLRRSEQSDEVINVVTADDLGSVTRGGADGALRWHFVADSVRDVAYSVTRASVWDAARTPVGDRDGDETTDYARVDAIYRPAAQRWVHAARYAQHSIDFLSRFTATPYPWPHMSAVEGGGIIGGGMEYPMMTLIGRYDSRSDSALYYVVAHELAHMWVPMIVNTNERRFSWLDEGTTTFNENNARSEFFAGMDPYTPDQQAYIEKALSGTEGEMMRWSDWQYQGAFGVASYAKPASVLHALRGVLGEDTFDAAYHAFFDRWQFKHAYPWDLWNTVEDVAGRDLDWFWRSWYYESTEAGGRWMLDQAVEDVVRGEDGSTRVTIRDLGWVPMPIHLTITRADGTVERIVVSENVWLRGQTAATVTVAPGAHVVKVEIDADGYFPDVDRSNNVWQREVPHTQQP